VPRIPRGQQSGYVYHVINRGNGRATVFHKSQDYEAFLSLLSEAKKRHRVKIYSFCLMPSHFHFVLEPEHESALSQFMQWLLTSHVRRYHRHYGGSGHIWQGRFKSFPIQRDEHLITVLRYVLSFYLGQLVFGLRVAESMKLLSRFRAPCLKVSFMCLLGRGPNGSAIENPSACPLKHFNELADLLIGYSEIHEHSLEHTEKVIERIVMHFSSSRLRVSVNEASSLMSFGPPSAISPRVVCVHLLFPLTD